jgi:excisionase family DNA binding protein
MRMADVLAEDAASPPLAVRLPEASRLTGIGRSKLYEFIAAGEIRVIKVGSITLIPFAGLQEFLEQRTA